jgi:4a-hydroxytetrahydrobiopterin dehydratase
MIAPATQRLSDNAISAELAKLDGWQREGSREKDSISKTYRFADYHHTMAFVNATAWISHQEDHHPDIAIGYSQCKVVYTTHSVNGLSINDFVCAAKIDALFAF